MSWGTCYSGSNNIHFKSPPIMSDGRNYATWQSGATINENIRKKEGITQNWEYRKYLIENADKIIKQNQIGACDNCGDCKVNINDNTNYPKSPFIYTDTNTKTQPYGYETSDLKNLYLSKNDLQSRQVSPVYTQDELIKRFFPNSK
jgi:hypothetical protein